MSYDRNRNAKVIIPLALVAWVVGILISREGVPPVFEVVYFVAFAVAVVGVVFYLMGDTGWRSLARRYQSTDADALAWQPCPTAQMARVSVDHPDFQKLKMRFVGGTLRVATSADALHLATLMSGVPILGRSFPRLRIPWAAVAKARTFVAPGWFLPSAGPGVRAAYDPNYTGQFVELELGDPPVYIQLPVAVLGDALRWLHAS